MAIPILLTVGALGVGYVALSRERAKIDATGKAAAPVEGPAQIAGSTSAVGEVPVGDTGIAGANSAVQALVADGLAVHADPTAPGSDPSTSSSSPVTKLGQDPTVAAPTVGGENAGLGAHTLLDAVYGANQTVTSKQQASTLTTYGPLAGMIW